MGNAESTPNSTNVKKTGSKKDDLVYAKMTRSQYNEFVKYLELKKQRQRKMGKPPLPRKPPESKRQVNTNQNQIVGNKGICKKNILKQINQTKQKHINISNLERIESRMQNKQSKTNFNQNYENIFQQRQQEINNTYYNTLEKHGEVKKKSMEFMSRQNHMNNLKNTRIDDFKKEIKTFNENVDPYKLLDIDDTMTLKQVSKKYKKLALIYHPDRGGNSDAFTALTKAYLTICEKIKEKSNNRGFQDLKNDDRGEVKVDGSQAPLGHGEKFNINLFNDIYKQNKLYDPTIDSGYGDWMNSDSAKNGENKNEKLFTKKFNIDVFNSVFNNLRNEETATQLQKYSAPQPLEMGNSQFTELGADPDDIDFTQSNSMKSSNLGFCDYKNAMTSTLLINKNLNNKKIKEGKLKSVEEIKKEREKINYTMDNSQLDEYNRQKILEKNAEKKRIERLKQYDSKVRAHHSKLTKTLENTKNQFLIN